MGSLIGALLKNYDLEKAIEIGSAAAAIVVTKSWMRSSNARFR